MLLILMIIPDLTRLTYHREHGLVLLLGMVLLCVPDDVSLKTVSSLFLV